MRLEDYGARRHARVATQRVEGPVPKIGVDEKPSAKGNRYLTRLHDLDECTVDLLAEDHAQESLDGDDAGLTRATRQQ